MASQGLAVARAPFVALDDDLEAAFVFAEAGLVLALDPVALADLAAGPAFFGAAGLAASPAAGLFDFAADFAVEDLAETGLAVVFCGVLLADFLTAVPVAFVAAVLAGAAGLAALPAAGFADLAAESALDALAVAGLAAFLAAAVPVLPVDFANSSSLKL